MNTIEVGDAELRLITRLLSAASSGGWERLGKKEQKIAAQAYVRLTRFDK